MQTTESTHLKAHGLLAAKLIILVYIYFISTKPLRASFFLQNKEDHETMIIKLAYDELVVNIRYNQYEIYCLLAHVLRTYCRMATDELQKMINTNLKI